MKKLLLLILVASIPQFGFAKKQFTFTTDKTQLSELGSQVVDMYLRGFFWPYRKNTKKCWKNDDIPNVSLHLHGYNLGDDPKALKNLLRHQEKNLLKLSSYKIIPKDIILKKKSLDLDYSETQGFIFQFTIKSGKSYVGCKKQDKESLLRACTTPMLTKNKSKAFVFEINASAMQLKDQRETASLVKKKKPKYKVMTGLREPHSFHMIKSECFVDPWKLM